MAKIFDFVEEYLEQHKWSKSTTDTYRGILTRFGRVYELNNGDMTSTYVEFMTTRRASKSPRSPEKYRAEVERTVNNYFSWMRVRHNDVWSEVFAKDKVKKNPLADIEFDDILVWLKEQVEALNDFRQAYVERIVLHADCPTSSEFKQAILDVQGVDKSKKRYENLITLVELYKEM